MESSRTDSSSSLLQAYLAEHRDKCPGCGYELHQLEADVCPECGEELRLQVGAVDNGWRAFAFGLAPLAMTFGLYMQAFLVLLMVGGRHVGGVVVASGVGSLISGALLLIWFAERPAATDLSGSDRSWLARACWVVPIFNVALLPVVIHLMR